MWSKFRNSLLYFALSSIVTWPDMILMEKREISLPLVSIVIITLNRKKKSGKMH